MAEEKQTRRDFLRKSIIAAAGLVTGARAVKMLAEDYTHQIGKLEIKNYVYNSEFTNTSHNTVHYTNPENPNDCGREGKDGYDLIYGVPPFTKNSKAISIIYDNEVKYELENDARPIDSITPVNLELSLHSQGDGDIVMNDTRNELQISFPVPGWYFGRKPISLWRRKIINLDEDPNDPNNYRLSFIANIREAIAKTTSPDGAARIPLPNLNGVYQSQVPYDFFQLRFRFTGDLNRDGKVDSKDLKTLTDEWLAEADPNDPNTALNSDISGPNDVPDNIINLKDFERFSRDYGKDANDPNTW